MILQHYDFKLIGKSGKDIPVANALSRAFLPSTEEKLMAEDNCIKAYAVEVKQETIRVRVGKQWKPARLLSPNRQPNQPRSYNVETEQGTIWRRK
ncbi:hypothetical protein HOLleu_14462 [Holothuria leucospilota]|uniref:Uncharacterized protein n=1 Tax=Holothuria leucospilota TaxID=206669 RepID=A0A9Q1HBS3_HOLLE|nr:hypothetical protein HOLleu_14462 [Holothuria leucospilota]